VLDGVSRAVAPGEIVGLVGASGAGKSTIARSIVGLARPDGGRVLFAGLELGAVSRGARKALRRRLHLVFQDPYDSLPPSMRVHQIVMEPLTIHGVGQASERRARVDAVLEAVELTPASRFVQRYPHQLSGGERQRVALARAIILQPALIVADEPTSMLDVSLRAELLTVMRRLRDSHAIAYLYITHDLALASVFCDRLLVLDQGRLVEEGPTARVLQQPVHPYTTALVDAARLLHLPARAPDSPSRPPLASSLGASPASAAPATLSAGGGRPIQLAEHDHV
jgi:peptide/nickel transport system ATP-binding protein